MSVKLLTFPNLSLSTIDISFVLAGILIVTNNIPMIKTITNVAINSVLMFITFLANKT